MALTYGVTIPAEQYSTTAVYNGLAYIGSYDNLFSAVNASTGALNWSIPITSHYSSAALYNGIAYVGTSGSSWQSTHQQEQLSHR
jgi:outer membrane protein assembly factor BamB